MPCGQPLLAAAARAADRRPPGRSRPRRSPARAPCRASRCLRSPVIAALTKLALLPFTRAAYATRHDGRSARPDHRPLAMPSAARWRSRRAGWSSASTARSRSTGSTSRCPKARSTASSAPTARARPRRCACCSASSTPTRACAACSATTARSEIARLIGYLPEERGLYPSMKAYEAIAFMGALRGLPLKEGRKRGRELLESHGLGHAADRQIRQLSKGMAQTVQLLGTLVHEPATGGVRRAVLGPRRDQPGQARAADPRPRRQGHDGDLLDPRHRPCRTAVRRRRDHRRRQSALCRLGRRRARPHPAAGAAGDAPAATARGAPRCRRGTQATEGNFWNFALPESGIEPLLRALIEGEAGILSLSIERAGLHDAFVAIAGEAAARALEAGKPGGDAAMSEHTRQVAPVAAAAPRWSSPGAISPRSCSAGRSSSSCSARCSRSSSARSPAASATASTASAGAPEIGIAMSRAGRRPRCIGAQRNLRTELGADAARTARDRRRPGPGESYRCARLPATAATAISPRCCHRHARSTRC